MEVLKHYETQILETLVVILILVTINFIFRKWSYRIAQQLHLGPERRKITYKIVNLMLFLLGAVSIIAIWGVGQKSLIVFLTSTLTVLGIGFFAQWSILSNITAGLLLFFNHPMRIGDRIKFVDKDNPVEGTITDISMFFTHIRTIDEDNITIPNSLVIQKIISITEKASQIDKKVKKSDQEKDKDIEDVI